MGWAVDLSQDGRTARGWIAELHCADQSGSTGVCCAESSCGQCFDDAGLQPFILRMDSHSVHNVRLCGLICVMRRNFKVFCKFQLALLVSLAKLIGLAKQQSLLDLL